MTLHPQAAAFLDRLHHEGVRPDDELTVAQVRAAADRPAPAPVEPVAEVVDEVVDEVVAGPGADVPVRVYRPAAPPVGVVLYLHGGGHVTGTLDSYDGLTRRLANRVPAVVVAVGYRRAPEHRCPAAVDDAEAAYRWVLRHAAALAGEGVGGVVVAGDSAGGDDAAVLARRLCDDGSPPPALQVLLHPTLDAVAYRDGTVHPSHRDFATGYGLTYDDGLWYWDHHLGPDGDPASPDASPLRAPSVAGLAPAHVVTVGYDVLRDEGAAYAARLRAAGVPVEHRHWPGHLHGFLGDPHTYDDADPALDEVAAAIRRALTG
ncbi:acetyl esterase [Geodermatophilus pulveris]|uniref:Acetyl esterase n=1 Tax=Geodermatophilus pulveris TaxID=1564159 RepID=A0A239EDN2_9ACTN|nr:alpha/beta hydrolase [Geodermatophilus pulveris]SNS42103.1 acetyl esterase [Geodermatophilus pulveris]